MFNFYFSVYSFFIFFNCLLISLLLFFVIYSTQVVKNYVYVYKNIFYTKLVNMFFLIKNNLFYCLFLFMYWFTKNHILEDCIYNPYTILLYIFIFFNILICFSFVSLFVKDRSNDFETIIIIGVAFSTIILAVISQDLFKFFIIIELHSFCLYYLTCIKKLSSMGIEAGIKYFILNTISSGLMLYSFVNIYSIFGTLSFPLIFKFLYMDITLYHNWLLFSFCVFLISLFFKVSAAPFHQWSPDVYQGAPLYSTSFFSVIPKIGIFFFIILYFFNFVITFNIYFIFFIIICIFLSFFIGSLGALKQTQIKRFYAYSSITNIGFILITFVCSTIESVKSCIFFVFIYSVMTLSFFTFLMHFVNFKHYITDLKNVYFYNKYYMLLIICLFFSFGGVPPFAGFWIKFFIFYTVVLSSVYVFACFICIFSLISLIYYLRFVKIIIIEFLNKIIFDKKSFNYFVITNNNYIYINNMVFILTIIIIFFFIFFLNFFNNIFTLFILNFYTYI